MCHVVLTSPQLPPPLSPLLLSLQSVYGVAHTAGKLTGTVAGLANAAIRAVAVEDDEGDEANGAGTGTMVASKFGSDRVDGGDEGYSRMMKGAVSNIGKGLARPVQGAVDLDVKETAKSVVALPVALLGSVVAGTLGLAARGLEGIADWSIGRRNLGVRRVARFFDIDGVLIPYNVREARGHLFVLRLKLPALTGEMYLRHWTTGQELTMASGCGRKLVLLTTSQLYCFSTNLRVDGSSQPVLQWAMPILSCSVLPPNPAFPRQAAVQSLPRDEYGEAEHRHTSVWGDGERNFFAFRDDETAREFEAAVRWIGSAPTLAADPTAHCGLRWALLANEEKRAHRVARIAAAKNLAACTARVQRLHQDGERAMAKLAEGTVSSSEAVAALSRTGHGRSIAREKVNELGHSVRRLLAHLEGGELVRNEAHVVKTIFGTERSARTFIIEVRGFSWRQTKKKKSSKEGGGEGEGERKGVWKRILWQWSVSRRYRDFIALRAAVESRHLIPRSALQRVSMPPKKFFGQSYSAENSEARTTAFRRFIAEIFDCMLAYPQRRDAMLQSQEFCQCVSVVVCFPLFCIFIASLGASPLN